MKYTKQEFLKLIEPKNIDINKSSNFMGGFGLADKFGSREGFPDAESFIGKLKTLTSMDLSVFSYDEPYWVSGEETPVVNSEEVSEEDNTIVSEEEESVLEESVDVVESENEHELEVDWEWVDSLEDSPENRLALDEYAEKFGQSLKRTMKVSNMAKKFKEALAE